MTKSNHPLSMLSASEINEAVSILKESKIDHENSSFSYINLEEPDKKTLKEKSTLDRIVKIVGVDKNSKGFEAEINLSNKKLLNEEPISSHAGPTYTLGEIFSAIQLTLEDSNYQIDLFLL